MDVRPAGSLATLALRPGSEPEARRRDLVLQSRWLRPGAAVAGWAPAAEQAGLRVRPDLAGSDCYPHAGGPPAGLTDCRIH